jgi:5-formyltetrahydrofolate cyclo-ligase
MTPEQPGSQAGDDASGLHKDEARRRALACRDALTARERSRLSAAICARAAAIPEVVAARTVLAFASFRSELDTTAFTAWALDAGKALCLPRVLGPRRMAAFRVADPSHDLLPGAWGISEPREGLPEVAPAEIDVVLVPGSAFDESGRRCGYGGGFYDNYLPLTRPGTPWIALAFEAQLVSPFVCEPHDLEVSVIVTERRVIRPA